MATEKRLIDATPIIDECKECSAIEWNQNAYVTWAEAEEDFMERLLAAPVVDAVEVVHGRWVDEFDGKYANPKYICSHCTLKALYKQKMDVLGNWQTVQALTDYCPNCGADMR